MSAVATAAPAFGHNELTVRLGILANDARLALERVAKGEDDAIEGWLAYGAALNEGREMFPGDREFGQWVEANVLCQLGNASVHPHEQLAAMWAARWPEQFEEARAAGNARTVRGIYAKWNEINAERAAEEARAAAEKARKEAEERAAAEAEARRKEQEARDEEERQAAIEQARLAAAAKAEAEKAAAKAEKNASRAQKKADKVKSGNTSADNVRGTTGTGENEWYTPQEFIERAREVMGGFDVDPASSAAAQEKVRAAQFFTEETNGLEQEWRGRVWLNPPYAQPLISEFMEKLCSEYLEGRCTEAIALTHNYTDTRWFQGTAAHASAICFTKGRVKFYSPSGEVAAPTQGQAFFYFGSNVDAFVKAFADVGFVVEVRR